MWLLARAKVSVAGVGSGQSSICGLVWLESGMAWHGMAWWCSLAIRPTMPLWSGVASVKVCVAGVRQRNASDRINFVPYHQIYYPLIVFRDYNKPTLSISWRWKGMRILLNKKCFNFGEISIIASGTIMLVAGNWMCPPVEDRFHHFNFIVSSYGHPKTVIFMNILMRHVLPLDLMMVCGNGTNDILIIFALGIRSAVFSILQLSLWQILYA